MQLYYILTIDFLLPFLATLPPLNSLRAFEAAGRHLNFRAAADELGVTQGAVAQQVRGLEELLGIKLFERVAKGLAFTSPGRSYHGEISEAFSVLGNATAKLKPEPAKVTISVTPSFAAKWLIPNLSSLTEAHPDIDLRVLATESMLSFHADGIDLAIRQTKPPFGANLEATLLFAQEVIAVASPMLVSEKPLPLGIETIRQMVLLHDTHNLWAEFFRQLPDTYESSTNRTLSFSQTSLSIDAALAGQGIALASRFLVERDIQAGHLVQVVTDSLKGERNFFLLALKSARRKEAVQQVIDWLLSASKS